MKNFNADALDVAMKRRQITNKQLALEVGITPRQLTNYKNGNIAPSSDKIIKIAEVLSYPPDFLVNSLAFEQIPLAAINFRSQSKMTAKARDAAIATGVIAEIFTRNIQETFQTPKVDIPNLGDYADTPEVAALMLRKYWKLHDSSVSSMIKLLEAKGAVVFSLAENLRDIDAFSFWHGDKAMILFDISKSVERQRFDLAHELAHLVLHKGIDTKDREIESQADKFASAFLMTEVSVREALSARFPSIGLLINLKQIWGVSLAALIRRLKELGILSEWGYRTLCIELSKNGYFKSEPSPTKLTEHSVLLPKIESKTEMKVMLKQWGIPQSEYDGITRHVRKLRIIQ